MWHKIGICLVFGALASASGCIFDTDDEDEDTEEAAIEGDGDDIDVKVTDE